jgi:mRNA-degrading endonuclease HigB of HigAB toxin-antitoxin module
VKGESRENRQKGRKADRTVPVSFLRSPFYFLLSRLFRRAMAFAVEFAAPDFAPLQLVRVPGSEWHSLADIRKTFPSADGVGKCVVFDVGGNKFRLVVVVHFNRGKLYSRKVMTHAEYSKNQWKGECLSTR